MSKKGYNAERERQLKLQEDGWFVLRVSGSIGAMDLIAIKRNINNQIEVRIEQIKSTRGKAFYFYKQSKWELERLKEIYKTHKIDCYFEIKFKNKGWAEWHVNNLNGQILRFKKNE